MADDNNALQTSAQQLVIALNNLNKTMETVLPTVQGTAATATGGAATLPGNPVGFLVLTLPNGTAIRVPYYAA